MKEVELKVVIGISLSFIILNAIFIYTIITTGNPNTIYEHWFPALIATSFPYMVLVSIGFLILSVEAAWTELKETQIIQHSMPITEQFERKSLSAQKWRNKK
jgi:hypothetical protein